MGDSVKAPSFGTVLRRQRLAAGLTQELLAERSGVAKRTVQDIERGTAMPRRETARRLMDVVGVTPEARAELEAVVEVPRRRPRQEHRVPADAASRRDGRALAGFDADGSMPAGHRWPVPPRLTSFIGRARELAEARRLLEGVRLLTLTGPGGCGKTRLSLELAGRLALSFPDGISVVSLAPLADPGLLASTVAQALGIQEVASEAMSTTLTRFIGRRRMLLVLDNFEHILAAGSLVSELLAGCPELTVLTTSRESLRLHGEQVYPVPSLTLPERGDALVPGGDSIRSVLESEAGRLFFERARSGRPDLRLDGSSAMAVADICRRLDGLPLAIELAAARARYLAPEALLARLERRLGLLTGGSRDLPARQRTLRDTIAWSYDLLSVPEQRLFRSLGVFAGGFTLDAAEAVGRPALDIGAGDGSAPSPATLDLVGSLVEKSLLHTVESERGEPRFRMLETIREYAVERLEASGELPALQRRHAEHFMALAEDAEPRLREAEADAWIERLQAEHDNLRVVLTRSDLESRLRLAGALARFWLVRCHFDEGRRWLDQALASSGDGITIWRARALDGAGWLVHGQGEVRRAAELFEDASRIARVLGDRRLIAVTRTHLGIVLEQLGEFERAAGLLTETLALFRAMDDRSGAASVFRALGNLALAQGDLDQATVRLEAALALRRQIGGTHNLALTLGGLGLAHLYRGDHERASQYFEESLTLQRRTADAFGSAWSLHYLGRVELMRGDVQRATILLLESLSMRRTVGDKGGIAQCLEGLGAAALIRGQDERAVHLFGAAAALRQLIDAPLSQIERAAYERDVASLRARLGGAAFTAAWAVGQATKVEAATAYAERAMDAQ